MKFIISHDVDHLYGNDHYRDLTYPKLWVRETMAVLKGKIPPRQWLLRMGSPFVRVRNHIEEVVAFDQRYGVPSTFYFGMSSGLGMSYRKENAAPMIDFVRKQGMNAGVHGICYDVLSGIKQEHTDFIKITGQSPSGIRMHYVRFDDRTFALLSECGYFYDSSEFDKEAGCCLKAPYRVGTMWEFPLTVMDGYLPYSFAEAKARTLALMDQAKEHGLEYVCVLFHDYHYSDAYDDRRQWYEWLIRYVASHGTHRFISYEEAIKELEGETACQG